MGSHRYRGAVDAILDRIRPDDYTLEQLSRSLSGVDVTQIHYERHRVPRHTACPIGPLGSVRRNVTR